MCGQITAVILLQDVSYHIVLGLEEAIEGLAGDACFFADFTDTDLCIALAFHKVEEGVRYLLLRSQGCLVAAAVSTVHKKPPENQLRKIFLQIIFQKLDNCKGRCYINRKLDRCQSYRLYFTDMHEACQET